MSFTIDVLMLSANPTNFCELVFSVLFEKNSYDVVSEIINAHSSSTVTVNVSSISTVAS